MKWQIWYTKGRTFNSDTSVLDDLPRDGALVVMQYYSATERRIIQGSDWYFALPCGMWDQAESYEYKDEAEKRGISIPEAIEMRYPDAVIVRGQLVSSDEYQQIVAEALEFFPEDGEFLEKDCNEC